MSTVLLVFQVLLALGIIGLVLIQRSDSDGFGLGSGSGFGVISGRAKANLLTRATAILAGLFMLNSLLLTILTTSGGSSSLIDQLPDAPVAIEKTLTPQEGSTEAAPSSTQAVAPDAGSASEVKDDAKTNAAEGAPTAAPEDKPITPVVPRAE